MTSRFHLLEDIRFTNGALSVVVVDLNPGAPDGFVGLPLVVTEQSSRHLVEFNSIAGFQAVPEPLNGLSSSSIKLTEYLFTDSECEYLSDLIQDGPDFIFGNERPHDPKLVHYVIYGENTVLHVLSAIKPTVVSPYVPA